MDYAAPPGVGLWRTKLEEVLQARKIHGGTLNLLIAALGVRLSRLTIPGKRNRAKLFQMVYGAKYGAIPEEELEKPLEEYRSLQELFTRGVPPNLRPIDASPNRWIVPCDSTVQQSGILSLQAEITAKGIPYSLRSLAPLTDIRSFVGGTYAVLFLSPRDCHRVFAPDTAQLSAVTHVPGFRLLVHPSHQHPHYPVFTLNERVIMELDTAQGKCLVVMVAGWGVGHITHPFPVPEYRRRRGANRLLLPDPQPLTRGQWLATFELGSTVIIVAERRAADRCLVQSDQKLLYGQPLFQTSESRLPTEHAACL